MANVVPCRVEIDAGPKIDMKISGLFNPEGVRIDMRRNSRRLTMSNQPRWFLCQLGTRVYISASTPVYPDIHSELYCQLDQLSRVFYKMTENQQTNTSTFPPDAAAL